MPRMVGYGINPAEKIIGGKGTFYTYYLAGNGVFIESQNQFISARICIAPCLVRGLEPIEEKVELAHGLIPRSLYDLAFSTFLVPPIKERYVAIVWNDGYHLEYPPQEGTEGNVHYSRADNVVLDIHSHGAMSAWFSSGDNADELGFKLYMVIGKVDTKPQYKLRCGVYGYYKELDFGEVFSECIISTTHSPTEARSGQSLWSDVAEPAVISRKGWLGYFQGLFRSSW